MYGSIKKNAQNNPATKYMGFIFVSGRGIDKDSRQSLLLNEFDPEKKFYRTEDIEYVMSWITKKSKNLYLVGIFGLGRRVFDP